MKGLTTAARDLIRSRVFERFDASLGGAVGAFQVGLLAWGIALFRDPATLPIAPLLLAAGANAALHAALYGRAGITTASGPLAMLARGYAASGFAVATVGATVAFCACVAATGAWAGLGDAAALRLFRMLSPVAALTGSLALAWGCTSRLRPFQVNRLTLPIAGLDPDLAGLRVAHLTDLHIGNGFEGRRLFELVDRVHALDPDLIVLTGDLFDRDPSHVEAGAAALGRLMAPFGVYAVLGNHDVYTGVDRVCQSLARFAPGVRLLRDAWQRIPGPASFYVAGVDDPGHDWTAAGTNLAAIDKLAASLPNDGPSLLLVHRPDAFAQAAGLGFPLVLAGHFHGGQVAFPGSRGRWNVARILSPFDQGLFCRGQSLLYVSRGLGFAGPRIRLGAPPEIALLELEPRS